MAQIREIKKRMVAVGTIERITKTMQMIATAKFTSALQRSQATKPYTETIRRLVGELSAAAGDDLSHPLIDGPARPVGREMVLVISSDRGLCGAYNGSVLRLAGAHVKSLKKSGTGLELETSGKKAIGYFKFQKVEIAEAHIVGDKPAYDDIDAMATAMMERFSAGEFDAVRVVYQRFVTTARQVPEVLQLLPLKPPSATEAETTTDDNTTNANFEFSPSSGELLADLLPLSVKSQLFQCFNDAVVSEQVMRMIAMKAASDNAGELKHNLKRDFNRARQAQITTELTEIISGAAALE